MKKPIVKVVVGIAILASVFGVSACHRHHATPAERADWMTGKISSRLNLDDQQRSKLAAVKDEVLAARAESRQDHRAIVEGVIAQVQGETVDQAAVAQLLAQYQAEQTRMLQRVSPKAAEWLASLRPEQRAAAAENLRRWVNRYEMSE